VQDRIASDPRVGQRLLRVGDRIDVEEVEAITGPRYANVQGLSLHADVCVPARDRHRLEAVPLWEVIRGIRDCLGVSSRVPPTPFSHRKTRVPVQYVYRSYSGEANPTVPAGAFLILEVSSSRMSRVEG